MCHLVLFRFLTILWAAIVIVGCCTSDPQSFFYYQSINFNVISTPDFKDLLITDDIQWRSQFYLLQKVGHFSAFAILFYLVFNWIKRYGLTFVLCVVFAFMTEVLQLYFNRNGRFYDVGIDMLGMCFGYVVLKYLMVQSVEKSLKT